MSPLPSPCCSTSPFPVVNQPRRKEGAGSCLLSAQGGVITRGSINVGAGWGHLVRPTRPCKSTAAETGGLQYRPLAVPLTIASPGWCLLQSEISQEEGILTGDTHWTLN